MKILVPDTFTKQFEEIFFGALPESRAEDKRAIFKLDDCAVGFLPVGTMLFKSDEDEYVLQAMQPASVYGKVTERLWGDALKGLPIGSCIVLLPVGFNLILPEKKG